MIVFLILCDEKYVFFNVISSIFNITMQASLFIIRNKFGFKYLRYLVKWLIDRKSSILSGERFLFYIFAFLYSTIRSFRRKTKKLPS
jgi:hypothetical protein